MRLIDQLLPDLLAEAPSAATGRLDVWRDARNRRLRTFRHAARIVRLAVGVLIDAVRVALLPTGAAAAERRRRAAVRSGRQRGPFVHEAAENVCVGHSTRRRVAMIGARRGQIEAVFTHRRLKAAAGDPRDRHLRESFAVRPAHLDKLVASRVRHHQLLRPRQRRRALQAGERAARLQDGARRAAQTRVS